MKFKIIALLFISGLALTSCSQGGIYEKATSPRAPFFWLWLLNEQYMPWVTDGDVIDIEISGESVYVGGAFSYVQPNLSSTISIDTTTGLPPASLGQYRVNGPVNAVTPDGTGGWYIGGDFSTVNGETRNRAARLNSDGSLHQWNPDITGAISFVYDIVVNGSVVYIAGDFDFVGGTAMRDLAAVDSETGVIMTGWDPAVIGTSVEALFLFGNTLYIGGFFNTVDSQARNNAAALDAGTGTLLPWDPDPDGAVTAITVTSWAAYLGGSFAHVNGGASVRDFAAAVDPVSGAATGWIADCDNSVYDIIVDGSAVYLGGTFTEVNGDISRDFLVKVDSTSGVIDGTFNPVLDAKVNAMALDGNRLYIAGSFNVITGGIPRSRLAVLDATDGTDLDMANVDGRPWNPESGGDVNDIALSANMLYTGCTLGFPLRYQRNNGAAFDRKTGRLLPWDPDTDNRINTIEVYNGRVYLGGFFVFINNSIPVPRSLAGAVDAVYGDADPNWDPDLNGYGQEVHDIEEHNGSIYVAGDFETVNGGIPRHYGASFDPVSGTELGWNPDTSGIIYDVEITGNRAYIGGNFLMVQGAPNNDNLAAVDLNAGAPDPAWDPPDPHMDMTVLTLHLSGSTLYAGGMFTNAAGMPRNFAAAFDDGGTLLGWDPDLDSDVDTITATASSVYLGGAFQNINLGFGGEVRDRFAVVDPTTGLVEDFAPSFNNDVSAIALDNQYLYTGGTFTIVDGAIYSSYVSFDLATGSFQK